MVFLLLPLLSLLPSSAPLFAENTVPPNTIVIEQQSLNGAVGKWTLITPTNEQITSTGVLHPLEKPTAGSYTIITKSPEGANAKIWLYRNGAAVQNVDSSQLTFIFAEGDALRVNIHYILTRVGTVIVHSNPPGLSFDLKGPNGIALTGTTPASFPLSPEGQYSVNFRTFNGCVTPPTKSLFLEKGSRITFAVMLVCEEAEKRRQEKQEEKERFISIITNGERLEFHDVPQDSWFASFVFEAAKFGIMAGYKDAHGASTGMFKPQQPVTLAELAAITHRLVGISPPNPSPQPENPHARRTWFAPFFTSAEQKGWLAYVDPELDPLKPATRGEVVVTLLHALDIPLHWPKGKLFSDVAIDTAFAAAIETAVQEHIVRGYADADGKPTGTFGPEDPVNRAEMAKIINQVLERLRTEVASSSAPQAP
ncbi:S-layer homology domain-containing protein [Candidatus Peregrinibacteria bacterium]|nr:S-layer homology domain-containing protein [Candidatus Peregrinibacteria bacterium]